MPALSLLVFCSGLCALVYQIGWLRELRLVFGASTHASAAVLAIFMGGLGAGGAALGPRADRHPRPLRLYAVLELGIAAGALASPALFALVRAAYLRAGGSSALGEPLAIAVRLGLSALVIGLPAFLMGGTLPAAARSVEDALDAGRRRVALLYGANTLGAVTGAGLATFVLLERLGTRRTVFAAAGLNVAVAAAAFVLSRWRGARAGTAVPAPREEDTGRGAGPPQEGARLPAGLVSAAAAATGFVFFLMELVWYRMLAPLLGGTTYTFGLILAVALAGIGAGGLLAGAATRRLRPTPGLFVASCSLEALALALPFAAGDRIAVMAALLRPPAGAGFAALLPGWALVCALVVLPAALAAGWQFPLLISLRGRGGHGVGRDTGAVYAWNTAGAIVGSLVGGFGLVPALGAPGCWRLSVVLLAVLALAAGTAAGGLRRNGRRLQAALPAGVAFAALALVAGTGPTAVWRHTPIGTGAVVFPDGTLNTMRAWAESVRLYVSWERDGVESSVAMHRGDGLAFIVNGKVDGNARADSGTQVMGPLVGAILHPQPRKALVIGLGTGSSAGWLAAVDSVERVDVAELEPVVVEVARRCAPVNRDALSNPKVRLVPGDGREILMTSRESYDLVFSEPSNPYRAGVAGLYTQEFYRAVAGRLAPGGIFSQWVQAYSVDAATVRRIAATLASVFGDVEIWQTAPGDLLFVCSAVPKRYRADLLAARAAAEPFRSALRDGWGVEGLEGFLAGYVAGDTLPREALALLGPAGELNTDDLSPVEFGFARGLGRASFSFIEFRRRARERGVGRPALAGGEVDWGRVEVDRVLQSAWIRWLNAATVAQVPAGEVYAAHLNSRLGEVQQAWAEGRWRPFAAQEKVMLAEALANAGDARALPLAGEVAGAWPAAAAAVEARLRLRQGDADGALGALERAVAGFRADPWSPWSSMAGSLDLGGELAETVPRLGPRVLELFERPFSVHVFDQQRDQALLRVAKAVGCRGGARILAGVEPHVPWEEPWLAFRAACYAEAGDPRAGRAARELEAFRRGGELSAFRPPFSAASPRRPGA
jgi:spermidine synthase